MWRRVPPSSRRSDKSNGIVPAGKRRRSGLPPGTDYNRGPIPPARNEVGARPAGSTERRGIGSRLTAVGVQRPVPIVRATALGRATERSKSLVAVSSGVTAPVAFVRRIDAVAARTGGRICRKVVAGHPPEERRGRGDFLPLGGAGDPGRAAAGGRDPEKPRRPVRRRGMVPAVRRGCEAVFELRRTVWDDGCATTRRLPSQGRDPQPCGDPLHLSPLLLVESRARL